LKVTLNKLNALTNSKDKQELSVLGYDIGVKTIMSFTTMMTGFKEALDVFLNDVVQDLQNLPQESPALASDDFTLKLSESGYKWLAVADLARLSSLNIKKTNDGMDNLIFDTLNLRVYGYRIIPGVYKNLMEIYEIEKDLVVTTEAPFVV